MMALAEPAPCWNPRSAAREPNELTLGLPETSCDAKNPGGRLFFWREGHPKDAAAVAFWREHLLKNRFGLDSRRLNKLKYQRNFVRFRGFFAPEKAISPLPAPILRHPLVVVAWAQRSSAWAVVAFRRCIRT